MSSLTLGSLFDGSGGFPLGGILQGIIPVWASEIEPFPIRVTTKRLPSMEHLSDITVINGAQIEPVDIITFGSPCTNMSIAGRREGLDGKQSVLFYEAIRIIKEMRGATSGRYPRYAVWENVPGAFSSNKGADFKAVLDALIQICEPCASVPAPEKGRWPYADVYLGDGWSVAYRTLDAQYFGVAQRRRRIYLVIDFGSDRAGEILFEREGMCRGFTKVCASRKETPCNVDRCAQSDDDAPGIVLDDQGGQWISIGTNNIAPTLRASMSGNAPCVMQSAGLKAGQSSAAGIGWQNECAPTLNANSSGIEPTVCAAVFDARRNGDGDVSNTITGNHEGHVSDYTSLVVAPAPPVTMKIRSGRDGGGKGPLLQENKSATIATGNDQYLFQPVYCLQGNVIDRADTAGCNGKGWSGSACYTLNTVDRPAVSYLASGNDAVGTLMANAGTKIWLGNQEAFSGDYSIIEEYRNDTDIRYIVRRLTPSECALLQGFPVDWCAGLETEHPIEDEVDWWTHVFETHRLALGTSSKPKSRRQIAKWLKQPYTDSAEYKLWGNGVALPCVRFVLAGIVWSMDQ